MFDPSIGRWLQVDPMAFAADDPNLYRYAENDPTNATDPSGQYLASSNADGIHYFLRDMKFFNVRVKAIKLQSGRTYFDINLGDWKGLFEYTRTTFDTTVFDASTKSEDKNK